MGANVKVLKHKRQKSNGFRGYEWMVDEILKYGRIMPLSQRNMQTKFEQEFKKKMKDFFMSDEYKETNIDFLLENIKNIIRNFHYDKSYLKSKENEQ